MDSLSPALSVSLSGIAKKTSAGLGVTARISRTIISNWTLGNLAGQVNQLLTREVSLAASATDAIDLSGAIVNALGDTVTMARVNMILFESISGAFNFGGLGGSNAWAGPFLGSGTTGIFVPSGGAFLWSCQDATGVAVTAGTGDILRITNLSGSTTSTGRLTILGA